MTGHPYTFLFSSGHHTPGSRLYSDLVDDWADRLHPPARTRVLFNGCLCNSARLAYGLFQLMHITWQPCCLSWASYGSQKETKHYHSAHNFATRV